MALGNDIAIATEVIQLSYSWQRRGLVGDTDRWKCINWSAIGHVMYDHAHDE